MQTGQLPNFTTDLGLSADELATLQAYRFDHAAFVQLREALAQGRFELSRNQVDDAIAPLQEDDVHTLPLDSSPDSAALSAAGEAAIAAGQVAVAILNGGMATRFGGRVKGIVEVTDNLSFLALKLRPLAQLPRVPVFLMNSFATDAATRAHLQAHQNFGLADARLAYVQQNISMRLRADGKLFRDAKGAVSFYAPGHGDLLEALADSPMMAAFQRAGGRLICVSNVDNLGATLAPKVVGAHLLGGKALTTELAARHRDDSGGAPVRRRGRIEVLEGFRFPDRFDLSCLYGFNTNSFVLGAELIGKPHPLSWFRADKVVEGTPVVQFERLLGELTSSVDSTYLMVPRDGPEGRFLPIKTPADLDLRRAEIRQRFCR